jgi:hypothetical protein
MTNSASSDSASCTVLHPIHDNTIPASTSSGSDSIAPSSAGIGLAIYGASAFFVVLLLFALCVGADAMGRKITTLFKQIAFTDGVGNVSLIAEIAAFAVVLGLVAYSLTKSFEYENATTTPPSAACGSKSSSPTTNIIDIFGDPLKMNADSHNTMVSFN